jgi:hypothetical protein
MSKAPSNSLIDQTNYDTTNASSLDGNIALIGLAVGRIYQMFFKPTSHLRGSANSKIVDTINKTLTKPTISLEPDKSYLSPELEKLVNDGLELHRKLEEHAPVMQEILNNRKAEEAPTQSKAAQELKKKAKEHHKRKKPGLFAAKEMKKIKKTGKDLRKPRHGAHRKTPAMEL